jgi:hypothetical protein
VGRRGEGYRQPNAQPAEEDEDFEQRDAFIRSRWDEKLTKW